MSALGLRPAYTPRAYLACLSDTEAGDGYALKQGVRRKDDRGRYWRVKSLCADNPESANQRDAPGGQHPARSGLWFSRNAYPSPGRSGRE